MDTDAIRPKWWMSFRPRREHSVYASLGRSGRLVGMASPAAAVEYDPFHPLERGTEPARPSRKTAVIARIQPGPVREQATCWRRPQPRGPRAVSGAGETVTASRGATRLRRLISSPTPLAFVRSTRRVSTAESAGGTFDDSIFEDPPLQPASADRPRRTSRRSSSALGSRS